MATFTITTATSVFITGVGNRAFEDDTPAADTLNVLAGAFLISQDDEGAFLNSNGAWTVTVHGTIFGGGSRGINLFSSSSTLTSKITIGADGQVGSATNAAIRASTLATISNAGSIIGQTGIELRDEGPYTIVNTGLISGLAGNAIEADPLAALKLTNSGTINSDIFLDSGNDSITNSGSINGTVQLGEGNGTLTNSGEITGSVFTNAGNNTITNSGRIGTFVDLVGSVLKFTNSGTVGDNVILGATTSSMLTNSGTLEQNVQFGGAGSSNTFTNSGSVLGGFFGSGDNETITNTSTGRFEGDVNLGGGTNKLTNMGTIVGQAEGSGTIINSGRIEGGVGTNFDDDTLTNTGFIGTGVVLGDGNNILNNSGTIDGNVTGGSDVDTLKNAVKVGKKAVGGSMGSVDLGDGDDSFSNIVSFTVKVGKKKKVVTASGEIDGNVDLGAGNDTFTGGANSETVLDNDGADTVSLGGGNDTFVATGAAAFFDGDDTIDGGAGIDLYDASGASSQVIINLSTTQQDDLGIPFQAIAPIAANTAIGDEVSDAVSLVDRVTNFENAAGGSSTDVIFGSTGANVLFGNGNGDDLYGLAGNDRLEGGDGGDFLVGGVGADTLNGGADGDIFWYFSTSDSGTTAATRDLIEDFTADGAAGELIDLSNIDAIAGGADDAFTWIGTNVLFSSTAGELRAYWTAVGQIIEGDVNGDGAADFSIQIADANHLITLSGTDNVDFVL